MVVLLSLLLVAFLVTVMTHVRYEVVLVLYRQLPKVVSVADMQIFYVKCLTSSNCPLMCLVCR